jgi:leucyl/phenylalanyl-tRNA---protein transferase
MSISCAQIKNAYYQGIFPLADPHSKEIMWLRPDPRTIIDLNSYHIPRSLAKTIRQKKFHITYNQKFSTVVKMCSARNQTWISKELISVYEKLHQKNQAYSLECWFDNKLVGGVFGLQFSKAFFAKSMFFLISNASKVALIYLLEHLKTKNFILFECQYLSSHLRQFGALQIPDKTYITLLTKALTAYSEKSY